MGGPDERYFRIDMPIFVSKYDIQYTVLKASLFWYVSVRIEILILSNECIEYQYIDTNINISAHRYVVDLNFSLAACPDLLAMQLRVYGRAGSFRLDTGCYTTNGIKTTILPK